MISNYSGLKCQTLLGGPGRIVTAVGAKDPFTPKPDFLPRPDHPNSDGGVVFLTELCFYVIV